MPNGKDDKDYLSSVWPPGTTGSVVDACLRRPVVNERTRQNDHGKDKDDEEDPEQEVQRVDPSGNPGRVRPE